MTLIQNVSGSQVTFGTLAKRNSNECTQNFQAICGNNSKGNQIVFQTELPTKGKKWVVGIASFLCPGLGQLINGQYAKAFGFAAGTIALNALDDKLVPGFRKKPLEFIKNPPKTKAFYALLAGALAYGIISAVDAAKNAKSKLKASNAKIV